MVKAVRFAPPPFELLRTDVSLDQFFGRFHRRGLHVSSQRAGATGAGSNSGRSVRKRVASSANQNWIRTKHQLRQHFLIAEPCCNFGRRPEQLNRILAPFPHPQE